MKIYRCIFLVLPFLTACSGNSEEGATVDNELPKLEFKNFDEKVSYCIGLDHGHGCYQAYTGAKTSGKFDIPQMRQGMTDYLDDKDLRIPLSHVDSLLNLYLLDGGEVNEEAVSKVDASYAIGMSEGEYLVSSLVARGIDQNIEVWLLVEGVKDGMSSTEPDVPYHEASREVRKYYDEINLEMGNSFLKNNGMADSVVTTESGLQYKIMKEGSGKTPNITDTCVVHYTGRFIDGRTFESTIPSKIPAEFTPVGVIAGWQEGLQLMKEGGQCRLFVPYYLGYGDKASGPIPAYSTLVFDIELIKVKRFK